MTNDKQGIHEAVAEYRFNDALVLLQRLLLRRAALFCAQENVFYPEPTQPLGALELYEGLAGSIDAQVRDRGGPTSRLTAARSIIDGLSRFRMALDSPEASTLSKVEEAAKAFLCAIDLGAIDAATRIFLDTEGRSSDPDSIEFDERDQWRRKGAQTANAKRSAWHDPAMVREAVYRNNIADANQSASLSWAVKPFSKEGDALRKAIEYKRARHEQIERAVQSRKENPSAQPVTDEERDLFDMIDATIKELPESGRR